MIQGQESKLEKLMLKTRGRQFSIDHIFLSCCLAHDHVAAEVMIMLQQRLREACALIEVGGQTR